MLPAACCAIIPAYNEAPRVTAVVLAALESGCFSRVLVVDDGSSDGTQPAASQAGAEVLRLEPNRGKPQAMLAGLNATQESVVCFLDADLLAVTTEHLQSLTGPVRGCVHKAQLAVFSGGRLATTLAQKITPMISGQRCLRRELLDGFADWDSGFGIETAINDWLHKKGVKQQIVQWSGAAQVMKEEKRGLLAGFWSRLRMYADILRAWLRSKRKT